MAAHAAYSPAILDPEIVTARKEGAKVGRDAALQLIAGITIAIVFILGVFLIFPTVAYYVVMFMLLSPLMGALYIVFDFGQKSAYGYEGEEYKPDFRGFFRKRVVDGWIFFPGDMVITPPAKKMLECNPTVNGVPTYDYLLNLHLTGDWDSHASALTDRERVWNHKAVVLDNGPVISKFGRGTEMFYVTTRADRSRTTISTAPLDAGEGREWG